MSVSPSSRTSPPQTIPLLGWGRLAARAVTPLRSGLVASLTLLLVAISGCGPKKVRVASYTEGAQVAYEKGLEQLEDKDFELAIASFEQVRTKFPYSSYAALAELRIADADFGRGRYLEAIDGYVAFIKMHPTHDQLDWASFRIGAAHHKAIPSGFFLFPSPAERDQTEARAARTTLSEFLILHPTSRNVSKAKELLDEVVELLVRHERYAAEFYVSRKRWAGAAGRYQYILDHYPGGAHVGEVTVGLADALLQQGEAERAAKVLDGYLSSAPSGKAASRARELRRSIHLGKGEAP